MIRLLTVLWWGCASPAPVVAEPAPPPPAESPAPSAPASPVPAPGLPADAWVEHVPAGVPADAPLPLVVAVHGLGDSPERFIALVDDLDVPARVIAPRGLVPYGDGASWWPMGPQGAGLAKAVTARTAADRVIQVIDAVTAAHPTVGKPVITGFSQGGLVAYVVALEHPDAVAAAVPIGGWVPRDLWPSAVPDGAPPIDGFHGVIDDRVPYAATAALWAHLDGVGWPVTAHPIPGVGHSVPRPVAEQVRARIVEVARAQAAP